MAAMSDVPNADMWGDFVRSSIETGTVGLFNFGPKREGGVSNQSCGCKGFHMFLPILHWCTHERLAKPDRLVN